MITNLDAEAVTNEELTDLVTELFETHRTAICAYIYSLVGEWEAACDLTQDTYMQLYQTRIRLTQVENPRAWLYRIASNLSFNELRRRKRVAWLPWSRMAGCPQFVWTDTASTVAESDAIDRALATLPADQRATLLLYSRHEFRIREIAQALGISESAVKMRLYRARQLFREAYAQGEEK